MAGWVRDAESKRLVRSEPESEPDLESKPKPKPKLELKEMAQEKSLRIFSILSGPLHHHILICLT